MSGYRAILCRRLGGIDALELTTLPRLTLKPGEVRLRMRAAGLNFPDVLMLTGDYQHRPDLPFVPGIEGAGEIIELAADVTGWRIGDAVIATTRTGSFAEEWVVPARALLRKPASYTFAEAAAFPVAATTAWGALTARGNLAPGETLLVLGAGGGTGQAAVAYGRHLGARVLAAASSAAKREAAQRTGAEVLLDSSSADWPGQALAATAKRGADVVFDPVGGAAFQGAWRCIAEGGRYLVIGFASGERPKIAANRLLLKQAELIGVRAGEQTRRQPHLLRPMREALESWLVGGERRPLLGPGFPLDRAAAGLRLLAAREAVGKIVLHID